MGTIDLGRRGLWSNMRDVVPYSAYAHAADRNVISGSAVRSQVQVESCSSSVELPV